MLYISLFCFLCLGLLFSLIIKNKFFKFVFMIIFEFFFFLDLVAIITKATHIDYSFVANIEKSIISVMFTVFLKAEVEVNLPEQTITNKATGNCETFEINAYKKHCLLNGLDDIDFLVENKDKIEAFEEKR